MANTDEKLKKEEETRSEEVADIIERFPDGWSTIVVVIMTFIVLIAIILGFVIKYPDTVSGEISVTGMKAPVRIVSNMSGRLHLLHDINDNIYAGDCIGYIESGELFSDVMRLDSLCNLKFDKDVIIKFPDSMALGMLGGLYNDYVLAYTKYDQLRKTKIYDNIRNSLFNQKTSAQMVAEGIIDKIILHKTLHAGIERQYLGDSILHASGALSDEALEQKHSNLLGSRLSGIEYEVAEMTKRSDINSIDLELAKIELNKEEELRNAFNNLVAKRNVLTDELLQWKNQYLLISPIDGTLEYLGFWRENVFVFSGKDLFSVSPKGNRMIGEMYMSIIGAGKVKVGQEVNVKLADYPYNEYGYVRGKVHSISKLTRNIDTSEGIVKVYLVEVSFPTGLVTNFGKQLTLNYEAIGTADIITKNRRLIERLFDNLKAITDK